MEENLTCSAIVERGLIEAYVAGRLPTAEAESLEAHYLTCDRCQSEIRLALGIRAAVATTRQAATSAVSAPATDVSKAEGRRAVARRIRFMGAAGLAAAAVLAGILFLRPADPLEPPASVHREEETVGNATPVPLEPLGETREVDGFRWTSVPDADRYRITLYRADGDMLYEAETEETWLIAPGGIELEPAETYLWKVEARVGWDRWVSSRLLSFVLFEP